MSDKWYCGDAKQINTKYGPMLKVNIDLQELFNASNAGHGFQTKAGKKMISLDISARREPDQWGNTHSVVINTWKPDGNSQPGWQNNRQNEPNRQNQGRCQGNRNGLNGGNPRANEQRQKNNQYNPQENPNGYENYQPPSYDNYKDEGIY